VPRSAAGRLPPRTETGMLRKFADDFKAFAVRGNAIDMAIGIVIAAGEELPLCIRSI